jgi:WD40 repeat protein
MRQITLGAVVAGTLSVMAITPASGREQPGGFSETTLWIGADVPFLGGGGVTADGTKLVLGDLDNRLYIRHVAEGRTEIRNLVGGRVEEAKPSPSGEHVAFTWLDDQLAAYQLRVITISTLSVNILYGNKDGGRPRPLAWMPDGRSLLAWIPDGGGGTFSVLSITGEPVRVVRRFEQDSVGHADVSPNGGWIAFSSSGLSVIRADGTGETRALDDPRLQLLGWFPDGRRILFASSRDNTTGVWSVDVDEGRASTPRLIKPHSARLFSAGFSRDGRFFAQVIRGGMSLIRFRGHFPKGGYDVQNGIQEDTAGTTTIL